MSNNSKDNKALDINIFHVDVLDGIRAIAVLIVVWFHIWQQSWLMPIADTPALSFMNINQINIDWLARTGYMMVVMMIFLSGFCLYLPYARHDLGCGDLPKTSDFYLKRVARIVPSYLFCIIAVTIFNIANNEYSGDTAFMLKDIISHLTFSYTLFPDISSHTMINGVLWTLCLEVQFYIIFPFIQSIFRKKPAATYIIMSAVSFVYIIFARNSGDSFLLHQLPSYLGVYANGLLGAQIFVGMAKKMKREKYTAIFSTFISIGCIYVYYIMMKNLCAAENINDWQLHNRFYVSVLFMIFVIASCFSVSIYRKIFSNGVMRFISTISFNMYIWHQFLAVLFKYTLRIPDYAGDTPPNELNPPDKPWMWAYTIICFVAAILAATFVTYCIEKPCSKLIMNLKRKSHAGKTAGK